VTVRVDRVGAEAAAEVHAVVEAAFAARPPLEPPAEALGETVETIAGALREHGGLVGKVAGRVVGACLLDPDEDTLWLRRFGVLPGEQHHGVAGHMVDAAAALADESLSVLARPELPATIGFWESQGFAQVGEVQHHGVGYVRLRRPLATSYDAPDADTMRALGRALADHVEAGDLVVLTGDLGAGKTTFAQGLGAGLGVRGDITSPTFVIARVHPSLGGGPPLVHVDAYRLGGLAELDDLDLDTSLEEAVTVVEWGHGLAEGLAESRLEVVLDRALEAPDGDLDPRTVQVRGYGPRWRTTLALA
jgi:tRNA threonylcarbamoyladenosine biosynthesis protein TsaE